jgi:O-antigen/teichoic acid export membrane protein
MKHLVTRSVDALAWAAGGTAARMVMQIIAQIVLARLLGPEQYGIFAIGAIVVGFSNFLSDVGLAYGLIQKDKVDADDIRFVVCWQWILGSVVAASVWAASGWIASSFGEVRAQAVISWLAAVCLLNALVAPALNLLKRELDFRRIQLANAASYFVGFFVVGIPLAMSGMQVGALVAAWLTQATLHLLFLFGAVRHPLRPLLWYPQAAGQWRYAASVLSTNMLNWLVVNTDRAIVARAFGTHDVGLYATAFNLVYAPGAALAGVLQPVLFSAASRVASDRDRLGQAYRSALVMVFVTVVPAFAMMAVLSMPLVSMLFGPKWESAAPLCVPLALAMPMFVFVSISTPVLWTRDHITRELRLQLPMVALVVVAGLAAAQHSLLAVAWSIFCVHLLRAVVTIMAASRACAISLPALLASLLRPLCWVAGVLIVVVAASLAAAGLSAPVQVAVTALAGVGTWLGLPLLWPPLVGGDSRRGFGMLIARLPPTLADSLGYLASQERVHD